ncbi:MAG: porin [Pseudomonadota bacterium]
MFTAHAASAQSLNSTQIAMYGVFDIGIGYSQHSLAEDPNYPIGMNPVATKFGVRDDTGMFNGGLSASRIGFRGSEDLGGGMRATFTLESGFNPYNGNLSNGPASLANNPAKAQTTVSADSSLAGQLFNREANVGLSTREGSLTIGRNYSFGFETIIANDPMEGSSTFSPFGYSGAYGSGGSTEDLRIDRSIKFKRSSNGFNFGALYKFGGQAGSGSAQSERQLNLGFESERFGIQGSYSAKRDAILSTNSNTPGALNITLADTTAYMLAGHYARDQWRIRAGYERIKFNNPSNPVLDAGISSVFGYPVGTISTSTYTFERRLDVYFAGLTYEVTPKYRVTGAAYDVRQNDFSNHSCSGGNSVTACSGANWYYSLLGDYKLSNRTRLYAGYMHNRVTGGFSSGFINSRNNFLGTGVRHTF